MLNSEKYKEEINYIIDDDDMPKEVLCNISCYAMNRSCGYPSCNQCKKEVIEWLCQEYKEPLLSDKEKTYLKNIIEPYGNNTAYVCRFITETLRKEFLSICINVDENSINSFEIPLIHGLKTWYKNMVLDKEYTLEELGL